MKSGYKQTEVGIIPQDWDIDYIGNIAQINTGGRNTQDRIEDGLYPFFVRSQKVEHIDTYSFDGEAVLTAGDGVGTGKVFHYINGKFDVHQRVYRITNFSERVNGYYFYLYFSNHFYNRIMQMTAKSSVDSVRMEMIAKMLITIPPITEQEAIATALSDADALIEALEALIAKKRQVKQGTMQELLSGKKRLPESSGEWEMKMLGELGQFRGGSGFPTRYQGNLDGDFPFFKVSDMNNEGNSIFMINANNWITESVRKEMGANTFPKHTIIFAKIGAAIFLERKKILAQESCIDNNVMGFVLEGDKAYFKFIHYLFLNIQLGKLVNTTALPSLNGNEIAELAFGIPSIPEQTAIAEILSDMDAEIATLETKLAKARQVKQGMMSELLTGRIRLI